MTEQWHQRNRHWESMFVQIAWLLYQANFQGNGGQRLEVEQFFITKPNPAAAPAPRRSIALELEAWARFSK